MLSSSILDKLNSPLKSLAGQNLFLSNNAPSSKTPDRVNPNLKTYADKAFSEFYYPVAKNYFVSEASDLVSKLSEEADTARSELNENYQREIAYIESSSADAIEKIDEKKKLLENELSRVRDILEVEQTKTSDLLAQVVTAKAEIKRDAEDKAATFDSLIVDRESQLNDWKGDIEGQGIELLEEIRRLRNVAANLTLSGEFIDVAKKENRAYWGFNFAAFALLGFVAWQSADIFEKAISSTDGIQYGVFFLRAIVLSPLCVIAGILATNAAKHRRVSVAYRTLGTRIKTLKPYLDEMFNGEDATPPYVLETLLKHFFTSDLYREKGIKTENKSTSEFDLKDLLKIIRNMSPDFPKQK